MPQGMQLAPILMAVSTVYALSAAACVDLTRPLVMEPDASVAASRDARPGATMEPPLPGTEDPDAAGPGAGGDAPVAERPVADGPGTPDGPAGGALPPMDAFADTPPVRTEGGQPLDALIGGGIPDAADLGPPLDGSGTGAAPLVIDDFSDTDQRTNALGGPVVPDNQSLVPAVGEIAFVWRGISVYQSLIEGLRPGSCPLDIRGYRTLRFRMRASAAGKVVQLLMGRANLDCTTATIVAIGTVTLSTTMTTYSVDLTPIARDSASFFQWSPPTDLAVYSLDDVQLVP